MLDVTTPANELALGVDFAQIYRGSDQFRRNKALIEELNRSPQDSQQLRFPAQFSQMFFMQFLACLWKQHRSYLHNSLYTLRRLCVSAVMAFLLGIMFWDLGSKVKTKHDLFNAMGSMFVAVMYLGVQNSSAVQPLIVVERTVLYRERATAMYSAIPYALAQVAIEIPYGAMQALLYVVIIYAMVGFEWTVAKFCWYLFFTFFSFLYFTFFGMMMIAMSPDQSIAFIMSSFFYTLWNLFSGFVIPKPMIPIWWRWYCWACPVAWSMNGLFSSQYGDIKDVLDDGSTVQQFLEEYYGFRHDFLGAVSGSVIGFALLFATMFAFIVKMFNFQKS